MANDFANVDNALVTLITNPNDIETFQGIVEATAGIDLTTTGTGTEKWPEEFVRERVKEIRNAGLISKDFFDTLTHGKRTTGKKAGGQESTVKRADVKQLYPTATFSGNDVSRDGVKQAGVPRLSAKTLYEQGFMYPKFRSGLVGTAVASEDFRKKPPLINIAVTAKPDTSSRHSAPSAQVADLAVLDFINDRPSSGLVPTSNLDTTVSNLADNQAFRLEQATLASSFVGTHLSTSVLHDYKDLSIEIQLDAPGVEPEIPLFTQWHTKATVPLEVLTRHLEFGNAASPTRLQHLYDLEKTAVAGVPGTGRDRTEWKDTIIQYAAGIGITINP